jgi:hypothetical protein
MTRTIKEFAYKKQAPTDAVVNGILNGGLTFFLLSGYSTVPVLSAPGGEFTHSLLGSLVMPAIVIAFVISMMTSKTTIKKRIKGDVTPPLKEGVVWTRKAWKRGIRNAIINIFVVYGVGGMILQFSPDIQIPRLGAALIVFVVAAVIAYIESVSAILNTPDADA